MPMVINKKQKFQLKVSSKTENLEIIRDFIRAITGNIGFNEDSREQIALAVDEACTNVIKHAHGYDARRMVEIRVELDKEKIAITIADKGKGFDPENLPRPDVSRYIHEARMGGLGIHLMRSLMDQVSYEINPGIRNKVSMIKYLNKSA
jgi:serine/threonine-protein kinase RsbW